MRKKNSEAKHLAVNGFKNTKNTYLRKCDYEKHLKSSIMEYIR